MRVQVKVGNYRGRRGYFLSWRDSDRAWRQQVFVASQAAAEQLAAVIRTGGNVDACLDRVYQEERFQG